MNYKSTYRSFLVLVLSLSLGRMALASTTWYVDGVHGSNGNNCKAPASACKTIGHAIALASSGDFIRVAGATYTENLDIGISLKLIGSGATTTIIDGGSNGRVVTVSNAGADVTLSNVTIQNGSAHVSCFFIFNCFGNPSGGGVFNMGTLTINSAIISSNTANGGCWWRYGRLLCFYASGGGIFNMGTLTINSAIISSNTASAYCASSFGPLGCRAAGGGITNSGTLTISNSTISGNSEGVYSGAGTVTLQNSIVADSSSNENCGGAITSNGYNISSDGTCNFSSKGDWNNTDPMLGPLRNNLGPTWTMALKPGSPAIDAGNPSGCKDSQGHLLMTDQRGMRRPDSEDKTGCDIGAFERQSD